MQQADDVIVIGAGVIGLTVALRLQEAGRSVRILEAGRVGREASWAGAGMLPPGNSASHTGIDLLRSESQRQWPELSRWLKEQTGIDNCYRQCGAIELRSAESRSALDQSELEPGKRLAGIRNFRCPPELADRIGAGYRPGAFLPDFAQVRNPRHLKALEAACRACGVAFCSSTRVRELISDGQGVRIVADDGSFCCAQVCAAAGAWSGILLGESRQGAGGLWPVFPIRGQIVALRTQPGTLTCVLECGRRYLVPRDDGLVLVGSTEERAGFAKKVTAAGLNSLMRFATDVLPELRDAEYVDSWSGLRPGSPCGIPYLGEVPERRGVFIAAGHFRNGLQMSPATADLLVAAMNGTRAVPPELCADRDRDRSALPSVETDAWDGGVQEAV